MRWFERAFPEGLPGWQLPLVLERLRGAPVRLEERVQGHGPPALIAKAGDRWSAQENVGHLLDLEPLWAGRVEDLRQGEDVLRPADLENRKTYEAGHHGAEIQELLARFRTAREALVAAVLALGPEGAALTALHPRLRQPMRLVDLMYFVAEHDDAHLMEIGRQLS